MNNPTRGHHPSVPISKKGSHSLPCTSAVDTKLLEKWVLFNLNRSMPESLVPMFRGDTAEYSTFTDTFKGMISDRLTDDRVKLGYLILYTSGTAKDIVEACAHLPPELGYKEARSRPREV